MNVALRLEAAGVQRFDGRPSPAKAWLDDTSSDDDFPRAVASAKALAASSDDSESDSYAFAKAPKKPAAKRRRVEKRAPSSSDESDDGAPAPAPGGDGDDWLDMDYNPWSKKPKKKKSTKKRAVTVSSDGAAPPRKPAAKRRSMADVTAAALSSDDAGDGSDGSDGFPHFDDPRRPARREHHLDESPSDVWLEPAANSDGGRLLVPSSISRYLFSYQKEGVAWLWKQFTSGMGGILADDMGLGKTAQSIAFLAAVLRCSGSRRADGRAATERLKAGRRSAAPTLEGHRAALVIVPSSVLDNWLREVKMWTKLNVAAIRKGSEKDETLRRARTGAADVVVASYGMCEGLDLSQGPATWEVVVIDEVHSYKNPKSNRYAQVLPIRRRCKVLFGLTGTPLQNNLDELHTLLGLCSSAKLGSAGAFKAKYKAIERGQVQHADRETRVAGTVLSTELKALTSAYILRRTKDEVLTEQLKAGKDEKVVMCMLTPVQKELYAAVVALPDVEALRRAKEPCDCGREGEERGKCCHRPVNMPLDRCFFASEAHNGAGPCEKCPGCYTFAVMNKLTKVCNHPALLQLDAKDEAKVDKCGAARRFARLAYGDPSKFEGKALFRSQGLLDLHRSVNDCGKMQTLKALLESFDRERDAKVLVFSLSTQVLDVLEAFVRTQYTYLRLDGGTPVKERQKLVDQFNDPRGDVFVALISTRAGGTGLNLQAANKVVVFDVNWNPTLDAQAQDRAYRLGQKRQVDIFRLVSKGTIEEMTFMRQLYKKAITRSALEKGGKETNKYDKAKFTAVQNEHNGELFGVENLLKYSEDSFFDELDKADGEEHYDAGAVASALVAKAKSGDGGVKTLLGVPEEEDGARGRASAAARGDGWATAPPRRARARAAEANARAAEAGERRPGDAVGAPAAPARADDSDDDWA
ncbi:ATP-dependent helicase [Aureococcus anophagefferens]|uniref:ATP-dependent helicase n=1 Tax=Aureococcus anophagefferens TaxID=44056 RepID=A0ABR1FRV8_AURAN